MGKIKRSLWLLFVLAVGVTARPESAESQSETVSSEIRSGAHLLISTSQESDESFDLSPEDSESDEARMFNPEDLINFSPDPTHKCHAEGDMYYEKRGDICYVCACFTSVGRLYSKCAPCTGCPRKSSFR
ncbi:uncharacterized protein LOC113501812 [Trichoplusia ni]|uniref:Uncharacterized protein LOC113501812 n=1 Tax=Trichoplusia ni TaxID=7111 RepID=A0A7E5WEN1_TRINI|nr:uncharacterized protein LOC113501812 [Trichoplusia ni]